MLSNSTWLIYFLDFLPVIGLGLIFVMLAVMVYQWRALSDAIGFGIARKRRVQKKKSRWVQVIVWMAAWLIAITVLLQRCGGIFCQVPMQNATLAQHVANAVSGPGQVPSLPFLAAVVQLSSLAQSNWFYVALAGFLVVGSVIVVRGVMVSLLETHGEAITELPLPSTESASAVEDAISILKTQPELDARTRIIHCYERMIVAAQRVGVVITSDQTARELETSLRTMLLVKGAAIRDLTNLFEEARYSIHPVTEDLVAQAQNCLIAIAREMKIPISV